MQMTGMQIAASLDSLAETVGLADKNFWDHLQGGEWSEENAKWYLGKAYCELLILSEALQLPLLRAEIRKTWEQAEKEGLLAAEIDPVGNPGSKWATLARRYVHAMQAIFAADPARTVTKNLESILRAATYSITNTEIFASPPQDENAVHLRIENMLRCVFPDLRHKPPLAKAIKNFVPDTGIPSIQTLIEYKFLSDPSQVGAIADQILADTRGYTSREWTLFIYVIYETNRFRPETEWRQLLRDAEVPSNTTVVVLTGEPHPRRRAQKRRTAGRERRTTS